jgi:AAA family ATP:ADP antiporter
VFGSNVVFGAGLLVASAMTFSAWRLLREESRLPSERATAGTSPAATNA